MPGKQDPDTDGTVDVLIEHLEQSLARSTDLVRLIQERVDPAERKSWENLNTILYAAHSAVTAEQNARST